MRHHNCWLAAIPYRHETTVWANCGLVLPCMALTDVDSGQPSHARTREQAFLRQGRRVGRVVLFCTATLEKSRMGIANSQAIERRNANVLRNI